MIAAISVPGLSLRRLAAEAQPVVRKAAAIGPLLDPQAVDELALAVTTVPSTSSGAQFGKLTLRKTPAGRSVHQQLVEQRRGQRFRRLVRHDALAVLDIV